MTRKAIGGQASKVINREKAIEPYEKAKQTKALGRHIRTFAQTKKKQRMTTYDDSDYMTMLCTRVSSAACAYFANACSEAYTRGQNVGNMKDQEDAQLAAFVTTCDNMIEVLMELSAQWPLKNLMAYYDRQDTISVVGTGAAGQVNLANFEDATMTDILQRMKDLEIPDVIWKVVKELNFYFKLSEGWTDVKNNNIPGRYLFYRMPYLASASIHTLITAVWAEQGELRMHCKKFGIKTSKFTSDWLVPREIRLDHVDALAYFQHGALNVRDSIATNDKQYFAAFGIHGDGAEARKWWFYDNPNESVLNYLAPLFYSYEAEFNMYGGLLSATLLPTGADSFALCGKFTATELVSKDIIEVIEIWMLFLAAWEQVDVINIELTGTAISNFDISVANAGITWLRSAFGDIWYGTGIDEISIKHTLLSYLQELMF